MWPYDCCPTGGTQGMLTMTNCLGASWWSSGGRTAIVWSKSDFLTCLHCLRRFGLTVCSPDSSTWLSEVRELNLRSCRVVEFSLQSDTARCWCECSSSFPWRVWHIPLLPLHRDRAAHAAPPPPVHAQSKSMAWLEGPALPSKAMHKTFGLFPAKFMHLRVTLVLMNFTYITVTFPYRQEWQTRGV